MLLPGRLSIVSRFKMRKVSKNYCESASHRLFKYKAKNRVDDLRGVLMDLQFARKESRNVDAAVLEEQVHQNLREWKAELDEPTPASSPPQGGSLASFSSDIYRLLQLCEEEDDASSPLATPKLEPRDSMMPVRETVGLPQGLHTNKRPHKRCYPSLDQCSEPLSEAGLTSNNMDNIRELEQRQYELNNRFEQSCYTSLNATAGFSGDDAEPHVCACLLGICPPSSAFLGPKCALWDCPRPAQGLEWCQDHCSSFHADLAMNEGPPGMGPVLRPGGIELKDGLLFAALSAKAQGKDVGIPECEGAATAKSPWNAPELFDLSVLEGETIREWLFFDKPRRAFESGNRKQRSLPDYSGRGWHESRKQIMNEFGGLKRSYYMDPQPLNNFEWHLYEYEINKCGACALYRLELKLADGTKNSKMITSPIFRSRWEGSQAEFTPDGRRPYKGTNKFITKDCSGFPYPDQNPGGDLIDYDLLPPYDYLVDDNSYYHMT